MARTVQPGNASEISFHDFPASTPLRITASSSHVHATPGTTNFGDASSASEGGISPRRSSDETDTSE
jgi:hypothetical protein